jgi:hypothetical protein
MPTALEYSSLSNSAWSCWDRGAGVSLFVSEEQYEDTDRTMKHFIPEKDA